MKLTWFGHASFKINTSKVIYIDPYIGEYEEKADIILISHDHYDHFNKEKINSIRVDSTVVVAPQSLNEIDALTMRAGEIKKIDDIKIIGIPAYNLNKSFHLPNFGLGYIIETENVRVYFAGDTDIVPEIEKISCDVALLPVGGTYTMNAKEAAQLIIKITPRIAIPMHYGYVVGTIDDAELFKEIVEEKCNTKVIIMKPQEAIRI